MIKIGMNLYNQYENNQNTSYMYISSRNELNERDNINE